MSVNQSRCSAEWGAERPRWINLLIAACDATSQRTVADKLGRSSGYVNRLLYRNYAGSYEEAEKQVLAVFGGDTVRCPAWNTAMALATCIRERRREQRRGIHKVFDRYCPECPNNLDRERDDA